MLDLPPLSLYIHIPWCVRKCPYCDFNSHEVGGNSVLPEQDYLKALEADLQDSARYAQGRKLQSIFFGGGTPSIVSSEMIASCIQMADTFLGLVSDAEITLEANPGTFEQAKFSGFREAGVNRLSIGIQSFNETRLSDLGRIHSADEAKAAVKMARTSGFDNINLDLMYGLPNQTLGDAMRELEQAIALNPEHISWYELTIEPNTEFYRRPPTQPEGDEMAEMSDAGISLLANSGYKRYEISAFAKDSLYCAHNLNYWEFGDYLGIGAGAHEKITLAEDKAILRRNKTRLPKHYMARIDSYVAAENYIPESDLPFEFCMNALRLILGTSAELFSQRTGLDNDVLRKLLKQEIDTGLLHPIDKRIQASEQGIRHLNTLLQSLLNGEPSKIISRVRT